MMRRRTLSSLLALTLACTVPALAQGSQPEDRAPHKFVVHGDHFELDGKPFQVLSGEMHYTRIPRAYWRARMQMAKAMGLNTIATYVFWDVHEPRPGVYDFGGNNDLAAFLKLAQEEHLYVLLRAGPYNCAEWEFGGFPAWLMKDPKMQTALRTNDPAFMEPVERWMKRLGKEVAPLQIENGGPVIATQIENEYGNFASDHAYMEHMYEIFLGAGFTQSLLYTADPSRGLAEGRVDGVYSGVNFGTGRAYAALQAQAAMRPGQPLFATEYWPGWFDLWGHPHETRPIEAQLQDLEYMLSHHASVNLYMFHGGTSFGMMAGASQSTGNYRGNVTSYDYDAPLDEAGHPTPKFFAYRDLILKYTHQPVTPAPANEPVIAVPPFQVNAAASLWGMTSRHPVHAETPLTMEALDQAYGYVAYSITLKNDVQDAPLVLDPVHDYAQVYVADAPLHDRMPIPMDSVMVGTLDRHYNQTTLRITAKAGARLTILVENMGRLNSTKKMREEWKGIRSATLAGEPLTGWDMYSMPMEQPPAGPAQYNPHPRQSPQFFYGQFTLKQTGDTFLDVRALGKGLIWVNGHLLGRFWNIGPQDTLYVPAPWLKNGRNDVWALDLLPPSASVSLQGLTKPILDGPTPAYANDPEHKLKVEANQDFVATPAKKKAKE